MKKILSLILLCSLSIPPAFAQDFGSVVSSDDRIRNVVYSENQVFEIQTNFAFQSSIELSEKEKIRTISIGDQYSWSIAPSNNIIFVKPLVVEAATNMIVVTSHRTYQFDLIALPEAEGSTIAYVTRFFYPEEKQPFPPMPERQIPFSSPPLPPVSSNSSAFPEIPPQQNIADLQNIDIAPEPMLDPTMAKIEEITDPANENSFTVNNPSELVNPAAPAMRATSKNYLYAMTGSDAISPREIYDDGLSTFLKFGNGISPDIAIVDSQGYEKIVPYRASGDELVISGVHRQLSIRSGNQVVCIFNETMMK